MRNWLFRSLRIQQRHAAAHRRPVVPTTRSARFELLEDRRLLTAAFQTLLSFNGPNGETPRGDLTLSGSTLFGMTERGGADNDGTIFSIPVTGGTPTTLFSFNNTNGAAPFGSLTLSGSTLYGMTTGGGANDDGTVFSIPVTGGTPTTLLSFNGTNGEEPDGSLTLSGSTLYGMTSLGGPYDAGTVFSIPVTGGTPTVLLSFNGTNGEYPEGDLTLSGSTLYGMTTAGGANGDGIIFSMPATGGTPTTLLSFDGANGEVPFGGLTLSGSTLYGLTYGGGANDDGTVFGIPMTGGIPTTLLSFNGTNGEYPIGNLTLSGSTLYGMTDDGGANEYGTIFSIPVTGGAPTTLLSFNYGDGAYPVGSLTVGPDGLTVYGMTYNGGANGDGTVFALNTFVVTPSGTTNTFTVGQSAVAVDPGVTVTSYDTDLTGATETITNYQSGDSLNYTPIDGITITGNSGGVLTLTGSATPAQYQAALQSVTFSTTSLNTTTRSLSIVADNSSGSPTTSIAAAESVNVVIGAPVVTPSGSSNKSFTLGGTAVAVDSGVTISSYDTDLTGASMTVANYQSGDSLNYTPIYGITIAGNSGGVLTLTGSATPAQYQAALQSVTFSTTSIIKGTRTIDVVALDTNDTGNVPSNTGVDTVVVAIAAPVVTTSGFQALLSFNGTNGENPNGNLILVGSTLYGMTSQGGANGEGAIFSIPVTGGTPTTLLSFNGTDGAAPEGSLTLDGSTLYGMTKAGGQHNYGTVFSIPLTGGAPTTLLSFNGTNGQYPYGSLTLSGSTLYGMTWAGGTYGDGNIFSIPVAGGTPTNLASFNGTNGQYPYGSLTLGGSTLYGMTSQGGANGLGTIFSIPATGGTLTTVLSFNGTNGDNPKGDLTLSGSTLYGMTPTGGTYGGRVFSIPVTGGTLTTLVSFNGTNGAYPYGSLTLSGSTLYGMTSGDEINDDGTIFSIPVAGGTPTTLLSFNGTNGAAPFGSLTLSGSTLYGMTYRGGANGDGTIFSMNAVNTFTLGGAAVAVDSGVTVTSSDTDLTGASMAIANYQSGDSLNYTPIDGITIASNSGGVLTLTGSATPAQYTAALQSVTFSTTSIVNGGTRTVDIVADDSNDTGNVPSNTGVDSVIVAITPPVLTSSDFQTLLSFNGTNGENPQGDLTLSGATLYGMTYTGGANNDGTIYSIPVTGGTPTILLSFNGTNGENPTGDLTLDGSTLYGTTYIGGANNDGTIFSIPVTGGAATTLLSFDGANGRNPTGDLTLSGSTLYGMTFRGGENDDGVTLGGTIFSIPVTGGSPTTLFSFYGGGPTTGLTLSGSTLYGMTSQGGAYSDGNIFSVPVTGDTPNDLLDFNGTNGQLPTGDLTLSGSTLYGMTSQGGTDGAGTIFSIPVAGGTPTTLLSFNGANGEYPYGSLTLSGSTLYGMTYAGGADNDGTIFSIPVTGGTPTTLLSFNGTNGKEPEGSLTLSGSTLYGMTHAGGANGDGTVFSMNTPDTFTVGGAAVAVDSSLTVTSYDTDLTGASITITNYQSGDSLNYTPIDGITIASNSTGVLTLTGSATPAQYTAALQSVTFSTTSTVKGTRAVDVVGLDTNDTGNVPSNTESDSVIVAIGPPDVTASGSTGQTFTLGGAAVAVDSGVTVTSGDTEITGASMKIANYQSGDSLNYTPIDGITITSNSGGVLNLTGTATPAQYSAALQSVTFLTTSTVKGTRSVDVVADDSSDAGNVPSNTGVDTVVVAFPPPVVTASGITNTFKVGGAAVAVDSGVTVTSYDTDLTGATETITNYQSGDALNFTNQGGISGSYNSASGVLTLTGTATVAQYQAALQSVTFSTTSIASTSRTLSIVAIDGSLDSNPAVEQVNVEYNVVTASGVVNNFYIGGAAVPINLGLTVRASDTDLTGATVTITNNQPGDTLNFNSQNGISGNYAGGVLTLSGSATVAQYQTALQSVTFSSPSSNLTTRLLSIVALDANDSLNSNPAAERVNVVIATVNPSGGTNTFVPGRSAVAVDAGVTVTSAQAGLTGATVTITNYQPDPDTLSFTSPVGSGISGSYASGVLTLSGSATLAQYTAALQSVMFSTTSPNTITRELLIDVIDGSLDSPLASESVNVAPLPPVVSTSGSTGQTFTLGGSAVAVDSGISVTSSDTDITGASETIANYQSGDSLNYTPIDGITIASNSGGVLNLTGSATPAQYTAALQSVTFSTTSINQSTRTIDVVADDSAASPTTSNTGVDTVNVAIAAPVVAPSGTTNTFTVGGSAVAVDLGVTVTSYDTDLTGATVTISAGTLQSGDTFNFTNQNGISGNYSGGVLILTGSATPAQYQTALQSVTFSTTSENTTTRSLSIVALDSNDTGGLPSNAATEQMNVVFAPLTLQVLHSFSGTDGNEPFFAGLTLVGSTLFGTTDEGGSANDGTVFSMNADGTDYQVLHSFSGIDGDNPYAGLTLVGSTLFGTTTGGGSANDGTVFSINPDGTGFLVLHSFSGSATDGGHPIAGLTLVGSTLFGTTDYGGTAGDGTVFSINPDGSGFQLLHSFVGGSTDGVGPYAGLTLVGSTLFGTTFGGGGAGDGTVFSINTDGTGFQVVHSFAGGATDGNQPFAGLTLAGSTLFGTTLYGGSADDGTVFSINTGGNSFQVLHSFAGNDGEYPEGGLTLAGSTLFGTTLLGGSVGDGTVFSINTGGTGFQVLHSFVGTDGYKPRAVLKLVGSTLLGTAELGGSSNDGTVFSIAAPNTPLVTTSGTINTFAVGGSAVAVDSGISVTSGDTEITGASMTITNYQSGDSLNYTPIEGITIASNSGGVLSLTGSATPAQYASALQSVTFSTTSPNTTTRAISIVAIDNNLDSNTASEQVNVYGPDLEITTTDNVGGSSATSAIGTAVLGNQITYTIAVTNAGTSGVASATIADTLPSSLTGATYAGTATEGATGFTASGSGSIDDTAVSLPAGSTVTYTVVATVSPTATSPFSNVATVSEPAGASVNASLVTGLSGPIGIAVSGNDLFVTNGNNGTIGEYDANTGATINASLITGLSGPIGIAISGSDLFVTNANNGTIGEYTTSGATINASLITTVHEPWGIAVSGADLFIGDAYTGTVGEYEATTGAAINASLVTGLNGPVSVAVSGNDLFVTDYGPGSAIGEYTTSGVVINASLVRGLDSLAIAVSGDDLFVTVGGGISEYTTVGAMVNTSFGPGLSDVEGIAVSDDDLYVANLGNNSVGEYTTGINRSVTDTDNVVIAAPVITANQVSIASTAGQTVAVDSAVTVKSFDTDVTGATMTIGTGYQSGSDTLHFTTQNGITGVYSAGVLTLSGSATPAQYQTALQSVTFSSTSTSVATRNISIVVDDSGDTGNVNSNTATTQITVSAPLTVTAAYISSTSWASSFDTYLSSHTNAVTGHVYGSSTLGYAFQTGTSAAQTQTLPWTNLNTITVTFSGPVSGVALGSLKLNGGSGGSTPSVTGFTSDGSNTYSWTLSGPLTNNKYAFGIASTSSSYGPAVVDSHGAGISGTFTTGQALPSGNGLAGSSFDFFFDVLPGDANRDAQDNATDINDIHPLASGTRTTSSSYNPYYDLLGAGQINATTLNTVRALTGRLESAAPTNPNSTQGVGTTGFVGLELGAQETGSSSSSSQASTVSNVVSAPASTTTTTSTTGSGSGGTSSTTGNRDHGRHAASEGFAATDEVVSDFDLVDLYV